MAIGAQVIIDGITYDVHYFKGQVVGVERRDKLSIQGGGSGYISIYKGTGSGFSSSYITSETTENQRIFLQTPFGEEEHFDFVNWDIPCRNGHVLSVLWVQKRNKSGPIFYVINHNLKQRMKKDVSRFNYYFDEPKHAGLIFIDVVGLFLTGMILLGASKDGAAVLGAICCMFVIPIIWYLLKSTVQDSVLTARAKKLLSSNQVSQLIQQLEAGF
jgi:hypothetical protein